MWATFARPRRAPTRHHGRRNVFASRSGDLRSVTAHLTLPIRSVPQIRNSYQQVPVSGATRPGDSSVRGQRGGRESLDQHTVDDFKRGE